MKVDASDGSIVERMIRQLDNYFVGNIIKESTQQIRVFQIGIVAETDNLAPFLQSESYLEVLKPSEIVESIELPNGTEHFAQEVGSV